MDCHGLSWSSCLCRICCCRFVHNARPASRMRERGFHGAGAALQGLRRSTPRSRFVPSSPPSPPPRRGTAPCFRAYRARARPCALRGGAVRAPDCARAREPDAGRTPPVESFGCFFAPAPVRDRMRRGAADAASILRPYLGRDFPDSSPFRELFPGKRTGGRHPPRCMSGVRRALFPRRGEAGRAGPWAGRLSRA